MHDNEAIQMMARSSEEIKSLRRRVGELQPKAEAYDAILAILRLLPVPSRGVGEDVAWLLDKRIEELKKAKAEETAPGAAEVDLKQKMSELARMAKFPPRPESFRDGSPNLMCDS